MRVDWNDKEAVQVYLRVKTRVDERTGCWVWRHEVKGSRGYPKVTIKGRKVLAHRLSYSVFMGEVGPGDLVLHQCDNSMCINPLHLLKGTHSDNMRDMHWRDRGGERKGRGKKLTYAQVKEIKFRLGMGETQTALAKEFGVVRKTVNDIARGKNYSWVPDAKKC